MEFVSLYGYNSVVESVLATYFQYFVIVPVFIEFIDFDMCMILPED